MKSKLIVNFNGTKEGITLSVKCDPGKTLYILALSKRGNLWGYSGAYSLSNDEVAWYGPLWYRPTKFQVYEMINGEVIQIDEITNERYGVTTNFYLLSGEPIETHFVWCNTIKEYSEKFNCKAQIESDYANVLANSFPELHFYTEMPKVALRSNYLGYNICRDLSESNRTDIMTHKSDIQYYNWWHPRPPHTLSDKEIIRDIIFGPNILDPIYDLTRTPEETIKGLFVINEKLETNGK